MTVRRAKPPSTPPIEPAACGAHRAIRCVIIEDEPLAAKFLGALLEKTGKVEVVGIARDASWGLTLCADHSPDAVFVDIRMPGCDGVALAAELSHLPKPPLIVFATGHSDRACEAFRLNAVDYLVKPLEPSQILEAVCRLEDLLGQAGRGDLKVPPTPDDRLPVRKAGDDVVRLIPRWEIVAAVHRERRTWVHTAADEFPTYYRLSELFEWLGDPPFVRIARESVVNLQMIEEVVHYGDRLYQVRVRDRLGTRIDASRSGAAHLAALIRPPI